MTPISFHAVAYAFVILAMVISLLLAWMWPRDAHGKRVPLEEMREYLDRAPRSSGPFAYWLTIALFMTLAMISTALTRRDDR